MVDFNLCEKIGNKQLMTSGLVDTVVSHSIGSPATMMAIADEILAKAIASERPQIVEKLFFEAFDTPKNRPNKSGQGRR